MRRKRIGEVLSGLADGLPPSDEEFARMSREAQAEYALQRSERNIAEFASMVTEWNFTDDDGQPVPITPEGVKLLDNQAYEAIEAAYDEATRKVPRPLPQPSPVGEPSEVALSLPQEPL